MRKGLAVKRFSAAFLVMFLVLALVSPAWAQTFGGAKATSAATIANPTVPVGATVLLTDDFEAYSVGTFPSSGGWVLKYSGAGATWNTISNAQQHSGAKSMQTKGQPGWAFSMYKRLSQTPSLIFFEAWVRTPPAPSGLTSDGCRFGFTNTDEGPWTTPYAGIYVDSQKQTYTAYVGTGTQLIGAPYAAGQWIKFKLRYDVPNQLIDVWVNDVLKVQSLTGTVAAQGYRDFGLQATWGGDLWYFDDVSVWTESSAAVTISGKVTLNGPGLDGVTLTFSNGGGTAVTSGGGYYSKQVNSGWSGRVTPSHSNPHYLFDPLYRDYSNITANQINQDYGITSGTVFLTGGSLNGTPLSQASRVVNVNPGAAISGNVAIQCDNMMPGSSVAPLCYTWFWGNRTTSLTLINGWINSGVTNWTVPISLTAPTTPGDYWVVFAFMGEFTAAQIASCTNWGHTPNPVWNDGNDIWDWSQASIDQANTLGAAYVDYLFDWGMQKLWVPATAVKIHVEGPTSQLYLDPPSQDVGSPQSDVVVTLKVGNTQSINSIFAALTWDPAKLSLKTSVGNQGVELGSLFSSGMSMPVPSSGRLDLTVGLTGGTVNGPGEVAKIHFTVASGLSPGAAIPISFASSPLATITLGSGSTLNPTTTGCSLKVLSGEKVWPGDANNDGAVNGLDFTKVFLYWGKTGQGRTNASNQWREEICPNTTPAWSPKEALWADCNGDGIINGLDFSVIFLNWGKTHP